MEEYNRIINNNNSIQKMLDEIKNKCVILDNAEKSLREKYDLIKHELITLDKNYINVIDTYSHIVKST